MIYQGCIYKIISHFSWYYFSGFKHAQYESSASVIIWSSYSSQIWYWTFCIFDTHRCLSPLCRKDIVVRYAWSDKMALLPSCTQQTRGVNPMLGWSWAIVYDAGPTPPASRICWEVQTGVYLIIKQLCTVICPNARYLKKNWFICDPKSFFRIPIEVTILSNKVVNIHRRLLLRTLISSPVLIFF